MIVRTWRGAVRAEDADAYSDYLRRTGLAEYARTPGHVGTVGLRRTRDGTTEYLLLTAWSSPEAVRRFAGDGDHAVFYPEDERYLVEADQRVGHFEPFFVEGDSLLRLADTAVEGRVAGPPPTTRAVDAAIAGSPSTAGADNAAAPRHEARRTGRGWWWRGWIAYAAPLGRRGLAADFR